MQVPGPILDARLMDCRTAVDLIYMQVRGTKGHQNTDIIGLLSLKQRTCVWQFRILWRHLDEANSYKLKLEQRLPGAGVGEELLFNRDRCFV